MWDTVILPETVISSLLSKVPHGTELVSQTLARLSSNIKVGGHLLLVLGRLRWRKHVNEEVASRNTPESLHPLTQLRKFHSFRLVRRIANCLPVVRQRRNSGVSSARGFSPFNSRLKSKCTCIRNQH